MKHNKNHNLARMIALPLSLAALLCVACSSPAPASTPEPTILPTPSLSPEPAVSYTPAPLSSSQEDAAYSADELNGIAGPDDVLPMHESYEEVKALNDDVIGWITIDGTIIDYPVVRAADNDYYLGRDVEKRKSAYGAIFMDFRNADPAQQKHIILYGHNMKNGTMFHDLMNYKQKSFFDENRTIRLLWDGVDTRWEIFLAYIIMPNTIYHIYTGFGDDQQFADTMNQTIEYAKTVKPSNVDPTVTIKPSDQVLTLSTCTYEYDGSFFAVIARRVK
ncbi:MAG: class B sortase [Candidatus Pelethousia sp.]|nr:class B sortase [Candidatus Pelethousia sp.]